jgi:Putative transposase
VRGGADQRKELEHLCRNITRPAIANERLKRNRAGEVVLQLNSAFKDGTTHIVMAPLEFMQRLGAPSALTSNPLPWRAGAERATENG